MRPESAGSGRIGILDRIADIGLALGSFLPLLALIVVAALFYAIHRVFYEVAFWLKLVKEPWLNYFIEKARKYGAGKQS